MQLNDDPIQSVLASDALSFILLSVSSLENRRNSLSLQLPPLRMTYCEHRDGCFDLFRFPSVLIRKALVYLASAVAALEGTILLL